MCIGRVSPSLFFFKAAFVALDLLTGLLVLLLLKSRGETLEKVFLYLWNPLILVSFSLDGHYDSLVLALLFLSFYLFSRKRVMASTFFLTLSFLSKFFPVLLLPFLIQRSKKKWILPFVFAGTVLAFSSPFFRGAGPHFLEGLLAYSREWRFNDSLFWLAATACGWGSMDLPVGSFRLILPKAFVVMAYWGTLVFLLWKKKDRSWLRVSFWSVGLLLLLSPTLHFWYLTWIVPFLAFFPHPAWLWFSAAIMLSQEVLTDFAHSGEWREKGWIKALEFFPFYLWLSCGYLQERRKRIKPGM